MDVTWAGGGNLDPGQSARGSISVLDGASFACGDSSSACQLNCRVFVSNAAGREVHLRVNGTIKPGSSQGRLTINGAFDSSDGRIELEVQSLGGGLFSYDEFMFGDPSRVTMGLASIEFLFLGDADPTAFLAAGLFDLSTFFKQLDASGDVVELGDCDRSLFNSARFGASAERFTISDFAFDPACGASFGAAAIPVPPSLALLLLRTMVMAADGCDATTESPAKRHRPARRPRRRPWAACSGQCVACDSLASQVGAAAGCWTLAR